MRRSPQVMHEDKSANRESGGPNVLLAAILIFCGVLWLVAVMTGKLAWLRHILGPYLPTWFPLANLLLVPVTCALSGLRSIRFKISFFLILVFVFQLALMGLSAERYPGTTGLVTVFLYFETFILVPRWNRRLSEAGRSGSVLHLEK